MGLGEVCIFLPGTLFSPCRLKKTVFFEEIYTVIRLLAALANDHMHSNEVGCHK